MNDIRYIDINCDVGEGLGNERDLFPLISSCSIACGGHAGDEVSMRKVIRLAKEHNVHIGAHPSYPDKENFGRFSMAISKKELTISIQSQLSDLVTILREEKGRLNHIKAHGALYNDVARNDELAQVFLNAISAYKDSVTLYVPFNSVVEKSAITSRFNVRREAFADRNYNSDWSLVPRKHSNSLITKPKAVLEHLLLMVNKGKVRTLHDQEIEMKAETYCLHGDTPKALEILMYLREHLTRLKTNIHIAK